MKTKQIISSLVIFIVFILALNLTSAVTVSNVEIQELFPGESVPVSLTLKNNLDDTIEEVSVSLVLDKTSFITIGSSEDSIDEIKENKQANFEFEIKAPNDIKPGIYNIPYIITYKFQDNPDQKQGNFGITVGAKTELSFASETENNIVGEKGKISLKIINNGLADLRFVSVKIVPVGYTLLSTDEVYIGTVNSDDFETASFDVIYTDVNAKLSAIVNYRDFDNNVKTEVADLPINVYTREKALELGLIQQSYTFYYLIAVIAIILIWFVYRRIRRRRRLNR